MKQMKNPPLILLFLLFIAHYQVIKAQQKADITGIWYGGNYTVTIDSTSDDALYVRVSKEFRSTQISGVYDKQERNTIFFRTSNQVSANEYSNGTSSNEVLFLGDWCTWHGNEKILKPCANTQNMINNQITYNQGNPKKRPPYPYLEVINPNTLNLNGGIILRRYKF